MKALVAMVGQEGQGEQQACGPMVSQVVEGEKRYCHQLPRRHLDLQDVGLMSHFSLATLVKYCHSIRPLARVGSLALKVVLLGVPETPWWWA